MTVRKIKEILKKEKIASLVKFTDEAMRLTGFETKRVQPHDIMQSEKLKINKLDQLNYKHANLFAKTSNSFRPKNALSLSVEMK